MLAAFTVLSAFISWGSLPLTVLIVLITVTYVLQVAAGVEESIDISGRMVLDLTAELGGGDTSPQCVLFPTVSAKILTSSLPSPSGSEPPTIPIQLNSLPPHLPPRRSVTSLNIHQPPSRTIERSRPRPKSQTSWHDVTTLWTLHEAELKVFFYVATDLKRMLLTAVDAMWSVISL